ncbi:YtkA-like protein [Pseudogracilibacillus auburnensis]|uniref:YtkA-like protein n=1 Tax=Pseudogracilibacillus auburnensis TaxID=1494959 RepID=A0A2V3W5N5_9BACI|nr:FixH family protein [Pseudogracilibacillus auburnensis]PXW87575.1 YtkA-like protein [Pseudogracilibacillus auburnensis]
MRKGLFMLLLVFITALLVACGDEKGDSVDELVSLDVEFIVPETADVGETVELKALVTYGDEPVTDADEVQFEVWETGKQDESDKIEAENHEDGTYTIDYTFEHDGVFEMYAHTTAHDLHTMPKKELTVGEGGNNDHEDHDHGDHGHGFHTEGFDLHFMEPENVTAGEETELMTHITMDEDGLKDANVRYEIWQDKDNTDWVDAEENNAGEYVANYSFEETGTYHIQIHVEDDEDLHEHAEYEVEVQ